MRFGILRSAWCAVLAAVVAAAGTSCAIGDEEIGAAQVVGVWEGDGGGRVTFHRDGRFEMSGIPREAIDFFLEVPPGTGRLFGAGEWELGDPGEGSERDSEVYLYIEEGGSFSNGPDVGWLRVEDGGKNPVMFFQVNVDKEYGYQIRRVESEPPRG